MKQFLLPAINFGFYHSLHPFCKACSHLLLDINIKGQMICDLLNPVGFVLPNTEDIIPMFSSFITMSTSLLVCILAGSMGSPIVTLERDDVWVFPPAWSPLLFDLPPTIYPHTTATSVPLKACLISCSLAQESPQDLGNHP